jgi:hypothetical protein
MPQSLVGKLTGPMCNKNGVELGTATLTDVVHLPTRSFNLFSVTKMTQAGWILGGNTDEIWLTKDGFDIVIPTPKGVLFAMYIRRNTEVAGATTDKRQTMTIQQAHDRLAHSGEENTRITAAELGWTIMRGMLKPCDACSTGKAKQKNVPKISTHKMANNNEPRVFLDIATVKSPKGGPKVNKPNWCIMVTEREQLKFSDFYDTKNGMVEPTCEQFQRWKDAGKEIRYVMLDNAGENESLQQRCESADWKFKIKFEYTAAMTPQQNHLAEIGLASIANRGRALMARANIPMKVLYKVWREAFKVATLLGGLTVITVDGQNGTRYKLWHGENPRFAQHLR